MAMRPNSSFRFSERVDRTLLSLLERMGPELACLPPWSMDHGRLDADILSQLRASTHRRGVDRLPSRLILGEVRRDGSCYDAAASKRLNRKICWMCV